jgi:arylsulfatase A-like enzyme
VPEGYLATLPEPARRSIHRKKDQINLPESVARQAMQGYYAAITFADAQVGKILDALDETGLSDNTIVVFTSDHGYHMGEHGHWQKITLFENAARVPLIIATPGMKTAGQSTKSLAEMVDFYPTLAELCGLNPPEYLSGASLAAVLNDPAAKSRDSALTQWDNGYSVRTAQYRYTEWGENGAEGNELYDHESDPQEMVNLANRAEQADTIARLSKLLHERIADARRAPQGVVQRDYVIRKPAP